MHKKMLPLVQPYIAPSDEMMPEIEKTLYSGYIAEGELAWKFEEEFQSFIGNSNTLVVQSGTAALHLALLLLNIGFGDEVISTPMTAEPTNTTIAITGAKVVWGDVDSHTGLLDSTSIRKKITERTKAIMLVHYAGMVCDMDEFNRIIEFAIKNDVELYTSMPSGWRRVMGALTAPRGSMWIYNGKSNFSKERKTALLVKKDCLG